MRRKLAQQLPTLKERIGNRLRYGRQKRIYRCPACRRVQSVPIAKGQNKLTCRRCGEIFLRRT